MTTPVLDFDPARLADEPAERASRGQSRRVAVGALLLGTALLYIIGLGASGYGNDFYAAAVQAGTQSWKAFFFGSFDSSNLITVDKPPLSLWPMELSGRIFGFNSWSMLVPQAIEGVATVWLLYATVRRWFGHSAGLLAGALLAITPVAVLMFRYNNPDAIMTLLVVAAAYCVTRALDAASTRWLLGSGLIMGLSFLAKGLQPFTVLPALALVYLVAAPTSLRRRLGQLLAAGVAVIVGAGWWVAAVDLTPAAERPYIGGSGDNSALGLAFGYNGLSRITGETGAGAGGGANFSGNTGLFRLLNSLNGGQIAWLLPTAAMSMVALAWTSRQAMRTDRTRAALLLWGGWLLVTGLVLSFASGVIHTYYTVELAPAIAALVAIGAVTLWRTRSTSFARGALAVGAAVTGIWSYTLLHRSPSWHPWVGVLVLIATAAAVAGLVLRPGRHLALATAVAGIIALGGGSAAYAVSTAATAYTGAVPSAGPAVASSGGAFGGGPGGGRFGGGAGRPTGGPPAGAPPNRGGMPAGGLPGGGGTARPGGSGATSISSELSALIKATTTKWAAAAIGSQAAGRIELATGKALMAIGGFAGRDDAPTLAQFQAYVSAGEVKYFIGGGDADYAANGPAGRNGATSSAIETWVSQHFTATTVGNTTVYDLSQPKASS